MEKAKVKIMGISCANTTEDRDTPWAVQYALKIVDKFGRMISDAVDMETEFVNVADKEIRPCLNCDERWEMANKGRPWKGTETILPRGCIIKNDYMAKELLPKAIETDGFLIGSPVHNLSYSSKFRIMWERFSGIVYYGYLSNKPMGAIAVASLGVGGGTESCCNDMNDCFRSLEMIPVAWMHGAEVTAGSPYELSQPGEGIRAKKDNFGRWKLALTARRVAEIAVLLKLGQHRLGDIYQREFVHTYHPPHGEEHWSWYRLDKKEHEYMMSL